MESLPDGYYYRWTIDKGQEGNSIFVMPDTDFAYVQYNGEVDRIEFTICVMEEETDYPIAVRRICFGYMDNFDNPEPPRID